MPGYSTSSALSSAPVDNGFIAAAVPEAGASQAPQPEVPQPETAKRRHGKSAAFAYRDTVVLALHDAGFYGAARRPEPKGLTRDERQVLDVGDIVGVPGWTIRTGNSKALNFSTALTELAAESQRAGTGLAASIQSRRGHDIQGHYVTMSLSTFVKVLALLDGRPVAGVTPSPFHAPQVTGPTAQSRATYNRPTHEATRPAHETNNHRAIDNNEGLVS